MTSSSSFFLGPKLGRWTPEGWAQLGQAIDSGILNETTWVELKAALPPNKPGGVETGRDLASLALRSGLLIVGVEELPGGAAGQIRPVDLAATQDRVDQLARNVPSPPIYVETRKIPDPQDPTRGVLLVGVPASGPHMVDGKYWGRGDTGKTPLSDAEVREHLSRRRFRDHDVLDQARDLDQVVPRIGDNGTLPRLYLRAVPTTARRDALVDLLGQDHGDSRLHDLLREVGQQRPGPAAESELAGAHWWGRYAHGRTLSRVDPTMTPDGTDTVLRLEDNGALEVIQAPVGGYGRRPWSNDSTLRTLYTGSVLTMVHDALGLAGRLADQYAAYPGEWVIGVRVDGLDGRVDQRIATVGMTHFPPAYTGRPDYEDTTITTSGELFEQPWTVTERILARLVRALGAERVYLPFQPGSTAAALTVSPATVMGPP